MQKLFLLACLFCNLTLAQAAGPVPNTSATPAFSAASAPVPAPHPIVGSWTWTVPGKSCTESLNYRTDGSRTGSSGEEITQIHYEISPMPSLLGFYRLSETVTQSNDKPDCAGDLHPAGGEPVTRFIQFSPKRDQFIVCKEEELKACFGPLKRTPE